MINKWSLLVELDFTKQAFVIYTPRSAAGLLALPLHTGLPILPSLSRFRTEISLSALRLLRNYLEIHEIVCKKGHKINMLTLGRLMQPSTSMLPILLVIQGRALRKSS